ncbi:MAG: hypothetical protein PHP92_03840 [Candidatus Nanoarchaeia archaeon]|nr:hypothetical protein [Candidatus Nanoarchaeia archaeon]
MKNVINVLFLSLFLFFNCQTKYNGETIIYRYKILLWIQVDSETHYSVIKQDEKGKPIVLQLYPISYPLEFIINPELGRTIRDDNGKLYEVPKNNIIHLYLYQDSEYYKKLLQKSELYKNANILEIIGLIKLKNNVDNWNQDSILAVE